MADTVGSDTLPGSFTWYLKVPLLLMIVTMNNDILTMLQNMIGIRISPQNYLWRNRSNMARRNINITVYFTTQRLRVIKTALRDTLFGNLDKKCIVYTNTVSCLDQMQSDIELWLNMNNDIKRRRSCNQWSFEARGEICECREVH